MDMMKDGEEEVDLKKVGCVRQDMREMSVSDEMTSDRGEWSKRTCCADLNWEKGRKKKKILHSIIQKRPQI
jgi:hypothetical protein